MAFLHGTEVIEQKTGWRPLTQNNDIGVIGLIGTAPDADAAAFPLNTTVMLDADPVLAEKLDLVGANAGTLRDAIDLIYKQGSAKVIVVRVAEGTTTDQTVANILGNVVARTGVWAFLTAKSKLGFAPKILIAPGFTSQRTIGAVTNTVMTAPGSGYTYANVQFTTGSGANVTASITGSSVNSATVVAGGANYLTGATAVFTGGGGTGATATVTLTGGVVSAVTIIAGGTGYTSAPTITIVPVAGAAAAGTATINAGLITGITMTRAGFSYALPPNILITGDGAGAGATATIGNAANAVTAEIQAISGRLRAAWIKDGPNSTDAAAIQDRGDYDDSRGYMIDPQSLVEDTTLKTIVSKPSSAAIAGMLSRVHNEEGYWVSPSNHVIYGIVGTARPIEFNISDPNTQAQILNSKEVSTIVRTNGFRVWGNRSLSSDPQWAFLSVRITADLIYDALDQSFLWAMDRGLNGTSVLNIAESVNRYLRDERSKGAILNGRCWIDPKRNSIAQLSQGHLVASFDIEPPAPMERLTFLAYRNGGYYTEVFDSAARAMQSQALTG
jgi:uncharacterized protein